MIQKQDAGVAEVACGNSCSGRIVAAARQRAADQVGVSYNVNPGWFYSRNSSLKGWTRRGVEKGIPEGEGRVNWGEDVWTCNVYVYDVLHDAGLNPPLNDVEHYFSPGATYNYGKSGLGNYFIEIDPAEVCPGDIFVTEAHMEVVASPIINGSFSSYGAHMDGAYEQTGKSVAGKKFLRVRTCHKNKPKANVNVQSKRESGSLNVSSQGSEASHGMESNLNLARGGGHSLSDSARSFFEPRLGHDLSEVRIHSDNRAAGLAASINAQAFTHGRDVYFGAGKYRPETTAGKRLLAHELNHVIQQSQQCVRTGMVQADFLDTLGKGWDLYWGLDDEGASFARELMEHYLIGFGDFDRYETNSQWNEFMLARPEIQRAMRPLLESIALQVGSAGETDQPWFRWGAGPTIKRTLTGVRLNELESMRLTLHGCHRIEVEVNYDVNSKDSYKEVIFRRISMKWVDVGDMHPGTTTVLNNGNEVDDAELTSAGSSFNIYIQFATYDRTAYNVLGGVVLQMSGWPPAPGAASPGQRG